MTLLDGFLVILLALICVSEWCYHQRAKAEARDRAKRDVLNRLQLDALVRAQQRADAYVRSSTEQAS